VISGFRREVDEKCALQGYYAASIGNFLPTFRDNLSTPSLRGRESKKGSARSHCLEKSLRKRVRQTADLMIVASSVITGRYMCAHRPYLQFVVTLLYSYKEGQ
jgi:hypothetical protein